jgi:extradiol dioxygenase family protein
MSSTKQISSSLTVLLVSDLEFSKTFYKEKLNCEVTEWWAIRDGLTGLALKLLQANSPNDVKPNKPANGSSVGIDVYCYVENWDALDTLYQEFVSKDVSIAIEPWIDENGGPWKEFAIRDIDGYCIAFGGVDGDRD